MNVLNFWHLKSPDGEICTVLTTFENCQAMSTAENLPSCREGYSLDVDAGFLTMTDPNPIDNESYEYVIFHILPTRRTRHGQKRTLATTVNLISNQPHDTTSSSSSPRSSAYQPSPRPKAPSSNSHSNNPPPKPLPNQNSQLNGNASHVLKVSSPSIAIRRFGSTSVSRGSRDGCGKERIGRRGRSGCTRCVLMPVHAFPGGYI